MRTPENIVWAQTILYRHQKILLGHKTFCSDNNFFFKSGIDKSTEWSTIPACPSLMCFFNRGDTEGTIFFEKNLSDVCVCFVLCKFVSCLILWFLDDLQFDDLRAG